MTLETDKRKAKEGEYIDIRWDSPGCPDSLMLIFDSGHKTDKIVVSDSGSTRIAVPNCNGKLIIRLVAAHLLILQSVLFTISARHYLVDL